MSDGRREGELDLIDFISSQLWDVCDGDDLKHLEAISDKAIEAWERQARRFVEREGANVYWDERNKKRRQKR